MEFKKERVYSAVSADELKPGDKVITALNLYGIKQQVKMFTGAVDVIDVIQDEDYFNRFKVQNGESYPLAYLVEREENCTNCERLGKTCNSREDDKITCCFDYKPKTEQKAEKHCRPFTIREAKEYILQNWFDGEPNVEGVIAIDDETKVMKLVVRVLELAEPNVWVVEE